MSYTISALNALYYDQTVAWFKQHNLRYNHNIVEYPRWLSVQHMPVEFKELLTHHDFFRPQCGITGDENSLLTLANNIKQQDLVKKISIRDYMPEVADLIFGPDNY